jgi:hypothetical protein
VVVWSLPLFAFAADAPKDGGPVSRYAAELRYKEADDEKNAVQNQIATLAAEQANIERAQKQVSDATFDRNASAIAIGHLRAAFASLDALPASTTLSGMHPVIQAMINARGEVWAPFNAIDQVLMRVRPAPTAGPLPSSSTPESLVDAIKNAEPADKLNYNEEPLGMPSLARITFAFPYQGAVAKGTVDQPTWAAARQELKSISPEGLEARFTRMKQDRVAYLAALVARFKAEIGARNTRLEELSKTLADLDSSLKEQKEQQSVLDTHLVWAVYGMIGALTLLFLSLKFFNSDVAGKVVENRSLVEVMSMAFMLLTIIILGTGNKIGQETLGTLLGTIAGYIFGKKMSETNHVPPQPQPQREPEPKKKIEPPAAEPETAPA